MNKTTIILIIITTLLASCSVGEKKYKIGVSQCSEDIWRDKQNSELRTGAYLHDNVELCFAAAYDSDERQIQQIDSLVKAGIDLLIVAPNQVATISPAIDNAYDRGIPVIVFERKTNSKKYTAYMGADNYEMGKLMGEYIATRLNRQGKVIEIMGLKGSSPAIERHNGFVDALNACGGIELAATLQGDWTEESGFEAADKYGGSWDDVDFVFGQNDRMALGVRKALERRKLLSPHTLFCGIDGLPGENGGIRLVRDSVFDATYIYPTHGDQLLQLAVDILEGKPYEKELQLMSALVTRDNANVLLLQNDETMRQAAYLDALHDKAGVYLERLGHQRMLTLFAVGIIVLLFLLTVIAYMYYIQKLKINKEREQMARQKLDFYTQVSHELRTPLTLIEGPLEQLADTADMRNASEDAAGMFAIVRRNTALLTQLVNKILDEQTGADRRNAANTEQTNAEYPVNADVTAVNKEPSADEGKTERHTLLIVDDNDDIRAYLKGILSGKYQVAEAADGKQGLETAREIIPDLIISDVMMPVMNGLEFCQCIKRDMLTSHIPVILLTARAMTAHQVEGYESGADAYITKPFVADVLLARIVNLLKTRQILKDVWKVNAQSGSSTASLTAAIPPTPEEDPFLCKFRNVVESRLSDSELSVESIGLELGLSRVQLYRKIKALTGTTPVDLLRRARLKKALSLLKGTDMTVSEVAYKVGFSTPSYFTKCFKDEFGIVPGEV